MDMACSGLELVSRTWDVTSKVALVSVGVVWGLRGAVLRERLRNGPDGATHLRDDKKGETSRDGRYTCQKRQ